MSAARRGSGERPDLRSFAAPAPGACPRCDATATRVVEDVSDEVTVFGCEVCGSTWADHSERRMP